MFNNLIYIKRRRKVIVDFNDTNNDIVSKEYLVTALKNLESYGYTFSMNLINKLRNISTDDFILFYNSILDILKQLVGERGKLKPMYPNFPKQVMNLSDADLYFNALFHYASLGQIIPETNEEKRSALIDNPNITILDLGNQSDFNTIFINLLSSSTSISPDNKEDLKWFVENVDIYNLIPNVIPNKEVLAYISKLTFNTAIFSDLLKQKFKTSTDVLRLCAALSNQDESLSSYPMFKSFKRKERRIILSMLDNLNNIEEDMKRYKLYWIRLGEYLHPFEYPQYKKAFESFEKLRNNLPIKYFRSELERNFKSLNILEIIKLLSIRPGEFARSLDRLLRLVENNKKIKDIYLIDEILHSFELVSDKVSSRVLLQLREHFKFRMDDSSNLRVFYPKGVISKSYGIDNTLPNIDKDTCNRVINICEKSLIKIFSKKELLGKVYIDEQMKDFIVPLTQRNASKSLRTVSRGSKFSINNDTKTIRCFIYWKQPLDDRVDIDLSAVIYDENFNKISTISYFSIRSKNLNSCHSGDITSAPNGASEFIDLDIEKIKQAKGRYISMIVNSFTWTNFCDLPICYAGVMERQFPNSGEIFEPSTVVNKADLSTSSLQVMPLLIDIKDMKIIWTDQSIKSNEINVNNVEFNKNNILCAIKSIINTEKPNIYDLVSLHVKARGIQVFEKNDADIIFSLDEGITPFDADIFMGKLL